MIGASQLVTLKWANSAWHSCVKKIDDLVMESSIPFLQTFKRFVVVFVVVVVVVCLFFPFYIF